MILTYDELAQLAFKAGFNQGEMHIMAAIAIAESGGDPEAVGDVSLAPYYGPSVGLWQIDIGQRANSDAANANLKDPITNANWARDIYHRQGFNAWSTFQSGKYLQFIKGEK